MTVTFDNLLSEFECGSRTAIADRVRGILDSKLRVESDEAFDGPSGLLIRAYQELSSRNHVEFERALLDLLAAMRMDHSYTEQIVHLLQTFSHIRPQGGEALLLDRLRRFRSRLRNMSRGPLDLERLTIAVLGSYRVDCQFVEQLLLGAAERDDLAYHLLAFRMIARNDLRLAVDFIAPRLLKVDVNREEIAIRRIFTEILSQHGYEEVFYWLSDRTSDSQSDDSAEVARISTLLRDVVPPPAEINDQLPYHLLLSGLLYAGNVPLTAEDIFKLASTANLLPTQHWKHAVRVLKIVWKRTLEQRSKWEELQDGLEFVPWTDSTAFHDEFRHYSHDIGLYIYTDWKEDAIQSVGNLSRQEILIPDNDPCVAEVISEVVSETTQYMALEAKQFMLN